MTQSTPPESLEGVNDFADNGEDTADGGRATAVEHIKNAFYEIGKAVDALDDDWVDVDGPGPDKGFFPLAPVLGVVKVGLGFAWQALTPKDD